MIRYFLDAHLRRSLRGPEDQGKAMSASLNGFIAFALAALAFGIFAIAAALMDYRFTAAMLAGTAWLLMAASVGML
jgi:hypothetical protein